MTYRCPRCFSSSISTNDYARKAGCAIGAIAGAAGGVAGAVSGAEIGVAAGLTAGPLGAALGGIAGAVVGAFLGGAVGGNAGVAFGEIVDEKILNNFVCLACEFRFGGMDIEGPDQPFHEF